MAIPDIPSCQKTGTVKSLTKHPAMTAQLLFPIIELPPLMKFTDAKRHGSKNFLYAVDDFGRHCHGLTPKNICLDSAHDNIPTYELLERWDINAHKYRCPLKCGRIGFCPMQGMFP